ncbi:MAG: putative protein-disulfide isomerase [Thermoplasmata archaeon]|jgi:protein-disulfide isomerase-like protein with CxxC motif|nr:putative protein-disulfide isomerase [Thermoplasmata archaeon]
MPKVEVVHMTSPVCHWSWGYEPVINRLKMRYGKQIDLFVGVGLPYTDRQEWLKDYEMTETEAIQWAKDEILPRIGMPVSLPRSWFDMPASTLPQAIAMKTAGIAYGPEEEAQLNRALMFAAFVEGLDTSDDKVLQDVVASVGLDNAKMAKVAQTDAPGNALGDDGGRGGHGANFYSLLVRDASGLTVSIPYAYDPARVEAAIQYVSGGKAKPKPIKVDLVGYAKAHGPTPLVEFQKVFGLKATDAKARLAKAEKAGKLTRVEYPRVPRTPFWIVP